MPLSSPQRDVPPAKRPRVSSDNSNEPANLTFERSESVWLEDGNIVLQASTTWFKVHRSSLARHSPVFKDMFQMGQNASTEQDMVDGCPLIVVYDAPEDIDFMLREFYGERLWQPNIPLPFDNLSSMLRMGRKYLVQGLLDDAVRRLTTEFPSIRHEYLSTAKGFTLVAPYNLEFLDLVRLALDNGLRIVLPAAYLLFSCEPTRHILHANLPLSVQKSVLIGREAFTERTYSLHSLLTVPCPERGCTALRHARLLKFTSLDDTGLASAAHGLFIRPLHHWIEDVCSKCQNRIAAEHPIKADVIWDEVPSMFGLPDWADLRDEHNRYMNPDL